MSERASSVCPTACSGDMYCGDPKTALVAVSDTSFDTPKDAEETGLGMGYLSYALEEALGIAVDRVIGQSEIVVRAINDPLAQVAGISGATELGDGRIVLILDIAVLTRRLKQKL